MKQEISSALTGKRFFATCTIILICLLGLSIPEWVSGASWEMEYRQSALQQSICSIFFGGVMLLLPFCACLPYATHQVDELRSSVMQWKMIRTSITKYSLGKILATALSSGGAIVLAFGIHSLIWNVIALPCDPIAHPYHEIGFAQNSFYATWYSMWYGLPMYASIAAGLFISGSTWAVVALATAVWVPDRLLTVAIPTCIHYLLAADVLGRVFGWSIPHPATLYNDALTVTEAFHTLLEYIAIFVIACIVYTIGLKRRAQHV